MVKLFFGLPGSGKTTFLAYEALKAIKGKKYENVYCNTDLKIPGIQRINKDDLMRYDLHDGLCLIDEAALEFNSRKFKQFTDNMLVFFRTHRHSNLDCYLYSQGWDDIDRSIRIICDRCYYIHKSWLTGWKYSKYYRIPYGLIIPDGKKSNGGEKLGEIIQGYSKPSILLRIFCKRINRKRYYRYFDSFDRPELPPLPEDRVYVPCSMSDVYLRSCFDMEQGTKKASKRKRKDRK